MAARGNEMRDEAPAGSAPGPGASRLVVGARVVLLALAAAAAASGFLLTRHEARMGTSSAGRFVCPMHPEVTAATPGECPICGMALSEVRGGPALASWRDPPPVRLQGAFDVARQRTFSQEVHAPAEVTEEGAVRALLHADEAETLLHGEGGVFVPAASPSARARVQFAGAGSAPADAAASWVEFRVESGEPALRPGAAGWVELSGKPRIALVVPSNAVLQSPAGPYVYASRDGRTFVRRPVRVGKIRFGLATVVSGLHEQERVATRSAFFLDAEARLGAPVQR